VVVAGGLGDIPENVRRNDLAEEAQSYDRLRSPAILIRHAFGPDCIHVRIDLMHVGSVKTRRALGRSQRFLIEEGRQLIIRLGKAGRAVKLQF
jgi:hypothetical protein